jgi:glutathione peroxidase
MGAGTKIDHEIRLLDGDTFSLGVYRGLGLLICNIASRSEHSRQLVELDHLYTVYGQMGLMVVGIPSNDFGGEPGSEVGVRARYEIDLRVSFAVTQRMVVSGERTHRLFRALTEQGSPVRGDFEKFIIDGDGYVVERFPPSVSPMDDKVKAALKFVLPTMGY